MSSGLLEQYRYTISNMELSNPPVPSLKVHKRIFLIKITKITNDDKKSLSLKPVEGKSKGKKQIVWSEQTLYSPTANFTIHFEIVMKKEVHDNSGSIIGDYTTITVSDLLSGRESFEIRNIELGKKSLLSFTVKKDRFQDIFNRAKQQTENLYFSEGKSWSTFLTYLGIVKTAIDPIIAFNPLAQQIWEIVSIIPNAFKANDARAQNIKELFEILLSTYEYIDEWDRLSTLRDIRSDQLWLLINTTCECTKFIKDYTEKHAAINFMKGSICDDKISGFKKSFDKIKEKNRDFLLLHIASNMEIFRLLGDIQYADDVGFVNEKKCLKETRVKLIKEIEEWVNKDTDERVLILSGQAGTGKSAVAHTIAEKLNGSFFRFSQSNKGMIKYLFSTISRNLADRNVRWQRNLVEAVKDDIAIRKSLDPETQFDEMMIKPSEGTTKRMIIIIDALDEAGDQKERKILLNLLFERSSKLPKNYRIIITSRPEHDIALFHERQNVCCKHMAEIDPVDTHNDIQKFIFEELKDMAKTLDAVDENWRSLLAHKAENLFIWARLTCIHIKELDSFNAAQRLKAVLSKPPSSVYEKYHQILDAHQECSHPEYVDALKKCVGALIVARKSFSVSDLQELFGSICGDSKDVKVVLKVLSSLFIGIDKLTVKLRPIHASLFDFFLEPKQTSGIPNRYYIDTSDQSSFTDACLRVMNRMLRFNICELETSHKRNRDIPNFEIRVAEKIPSYLSYACCFWAYHLECSKISQGLLDEIYDLMRNKLLYLFEVLSLLREVEQGHFGMKCLNIVVKDKNPTLAAWAVEASQFVSEFGDMIMESTPHLYLSTLPYISKSSFISQQFLPRYPQLLSMDTRVNPPISLRPAIENSIVQRHPSSNVETIAFSPKNRQIAAGFENGDLWVWNYVTGEIHYRKITEESVTAPCNVVFSLDGQLVYWCFKDGSIVTLETKTKKASYESNEEFASGPGEYRPNNYCTISPDGFYNAFEDRSTLFFYERKSRKEFFSENISEVQASFHGSFSPSGRFFGFLSPQSLRRQTMVFRLWETREKKFLPSLPITDDHPLAVVLGDNHVILAFPCVYKLCDIQTGQLVFRHEPSPILLTLQTSQEARLVISTNGNDLLLSSGYTRWVWKLSTEEISQRFIKYNMWAIIHRSALSSDAKYVAFSINDTTHVLAWDDLYQNEIEEHNDGSLKVRRPRFIDIVVYMARLKGQYLVLGGWDNSLQKICLRVLDTTGMVVFSEIIHATNGLPEVSPEESHWSIAFTSAHELFIWNIDEKKKYTLDESAEPAGFTCLAFSTTGDRLLSSNDKNNIKVWNVRTRTLISCSESSGLVTAFAFSSTSTTFWVAYRKNNDAFIEKRESESQLKIERCILYDSYIISSLSVSSSNAYMCVLSQFHSTPRLCISDCTTRESIFSAENVLHPVFSPNQSYVAWLSNEDHQIVQLWNLEEGSLLDELSLDSSVANIEFSNDSTRLCILFSAPYPCVGIYDIETKTLVRQHRFTNPFQLEQLADVKMGLYGDSLLLVGTDGIRIWDLLVHEIVTCLYEDYVNDSQSGMTVTSRHPKTEQLIEDYKLHTEDTKILDYALTSWNKASFLPWTKFDPNGWILGPNDELLCWVPWQIRDLLQYPSMTFRPYQRKLKKLNFDKFVHGTRWTDCEKQPNL